MRPPVLLSSPNWACGLGTADGVWIIYIFPDVSSQYEMRCSESDWVKQRYMQPTCVYWEAQGMMHEGTFALARIQTCRNMIMGLRRIGARQAVTTPRGPLHLGVLMPASWVALKHNTPRARSTCCRHTYRAEEAGNGAFCEGWRVEGGGSMLVTGRGIIAGVPLGEEIME